MSRYEIVGATSTAIVQARSSMGPVVFEATGLAGTVELTLVEGAIDLDQPVAATIEVPMRNLRSGNDLFDSELARRIEARVHPLTTLSLGSIEAEAAGAYRLSGSMVFHGVERVLNGGVTIEHADDHRLVVSGEKTLDIRDFQIPAPTMLMLKIYPEVRVALLAEAVRSGDGADPPGVS